MGQIVSTHRQRKASVYSLVCLVMACWQCHHVPTSKQQAAAVTATSFSAIPTTGLTLEHAAPAVEIPLLLRDDVNALQQSIIKLQHQQGLNPNDASIFQTLSEAYFYLADEHLAMHAPFDQQAQLDAYSNGILAGERALALSCSAFATHLQHGASFEVALSALDANHYIPTFWYAQNLNAFALQRGVPTLLMYQKRLQALFELLFTWDPDAYFAGAQRLQGRFLTQAPAIAGGNFVRGHETLEQALSRAPNYFANAVSLAQFWAIPSHDKAKFLQLLETVRSGDLKTPTSQQDVQHLAQRHAEWLLAHTDTFF